MNEVIERVKVICAPPGSVLVFVVKCDISQDEVERVGTGLVRSLPQYQVIVMTDLEDIHAIVPESPPPVVNNYTHAGDPYHTPDRTMEVPK